MIFDLKRLVRVSNQDESKGGTGYLLGRNRVLTARHVFENLDAPVVWFNNHEGRKIQAVLAGEPWLGPDSLDIAVLPIHSDLRLGNQRLDGQPLEADTRWGSRGWAVAGNSLAGGPLVAASMTGLSGMAYRFSEEEETLQLTVDSPPKGTEWWKGASGAPVFCNTRLVGVVRGGPDCFDGNRLYATPIARAWRLPGFPEAVGYGEEDEELRQTRRRQFIKDLTDILLRSETAARVIAEENSAWQQAFNDQKGMQPLAEALAESSSWRDVLGAFARVQEKIHKQRPHDWQAIEQVILEVFERALPEVYGSTELEVVEGFEGGQLVNLPSETLTMAELAMAALDGRKVHFQKLTSLQEEPQGTALVPMEPGGKEKGPSQGIDFRGENSFHAWLVRLAEQCLPARDLLLAEEKRYDELAQLVNLQFETEVRHKLPRRYFVYTGKFAADHGPFLDQVGEKLRALHRVEQFGRSKVQERIDCGPLLDILFRFHKERTPKA